VVDEDVEVVVVVVVVVDRVEVDVVVVESVFSEVKKVVVCVVVVLIKSQAESAKATKNKVIKRNSLCFIIYPPKDVKILYHIFTYFQEWVLSFLDF